jgi:8-oxo-dGTP diphosphatase
VLNAERPIRAAGGIVWRQREGGVEVLLVHRPKYDDWTLPKGKALEGESDEDCALREIREETGLRCELDDELASSSYAVAGRPKLVRYWRMRPIDGDFAPHREVDEIRWLTPDDARRLLSWDRDRAVLESFAASL